MDIERIVASKYLESHPEDAAPILEKHAVDELGSLMENVPSHIAAGVIQRMNVRVATQCLTQLHPEKAGAIVEHLSVEDATLLLRRVEVAHRAAIFDHLESETSMLIQDALEFPAGSAGALMDAGVLTVLDNMTVEEGIEEARTNAHRLFKYLYVLNRDKKLMGVLNFRELFMAPPTVSIASIMQKNVQKVAVYSDLQAVEAHAGWFSYSALPVVEEGNRFVGVLRYKSLHKLEREGKENRLPGQLEAAGVALGELYKIGLSGLVRSAISITDSGK